MISVSYNRKLGRLDFVLDLPMPKECSEHPEFLSFLNIFAASGGSCARNAESAVTSFAIGTEEWKTFIAQSLSRQDAAFQMEILDQLIASEGEGQQEGLQINFHQNPYDTPARYWHFILNQGNFREYFFNRVNWYMVPRHRLVPPFPLHVDIESASTCNMDCPMCYRRGLKDTGQMDFALFQSIVDECAREGVFSVRLSWRGETLTHPLIREMIQYACERIPNVSFLTNAFYIDESMARSFIESGVSYIAVSFDGIEDVYEKIRFPAKFKENHDRLAQLLAMRDAAGTASPQVRVCTIWPAIKDDPEAYTRMMKPVSDYIVCNPYINFTGPMEIKPDFICQYPWERLVVSYNGDTQCCTGWNASDIILGNAGDVALKQMWLSPQLSKLRDIHASGKRLDVGSCAECRHGSKGDANVSIDEILERRW